MKSEQEESLGLILRICPGFEIRVRQLYEQDDDFRSLCSDYFCCLRDLKKYKKLSEGERQSIEEYENVRNDLESEIFGFLFSRKY
jgi:hypothetical protein